MAKSQNVKRVTQRSKKKHVIKKRRRSAKKPNKFQIAMKKLKQMNSNQQRQVLSMANTTFIKQMCAQVKKLRHAPLSTALKKRMKQQKKNLNKLVLPRTSIHVKRKMLTQRGGFLPLLISALPAVGAMLGNIISGAKRRH